MDLQTYRRRISELSRYLPYLPGPLNQRLDDATLFSIIKKSAPTWHNIFIETNARANINDLNALMDYYTALEQQEKTRNAKQLRNRRNDTRNQNDHGRDNNQNNRDQPHSSARNTTNQDQSRNWTYYRPV